MPHNIQIRTIGSQSQIGLIKIRGSLDTLLAYDLEKTGHTLLKNGVNNYIVSLEHLDYISSAGIQLFHSLAHELRKNQGELVFTEVPDKIYGVFEKIGLTALFQIRPTITEALKEFERAGTKNCNYSAAD